MAKIRDYFETNFVFSITTTELFNELYHLLSPIVEILEKLDSRFYEINVLNLEIEGTERQLSN